MNRRMFLSILGLGAAAATVADKAVGAILEPSKEFLDDIGSWHSYSEIYPNLKTTFDLPKDSVIYFDRDLISTLKRRDDLFDALASHREIPVSTGVRREFFRYES